MGSLHSQTEWAEINKRELEATKRDKQMSKQRWGVVWTPYGLLRVIIIVGLLGGAAFVDGVLSAIMIISGLLFLLYSYIATYFNVKQHNKHSKE